MVTITNAVSNGKLSEKLYELSLQNISTYKVGFREITQGFFPTALHKQVSSLSSRLMVVSQNVLSDALDVGFTCDIHSQMTRISQFLSGDESYKIRLNGQERVSFLFVRTKTLPEHPYMKPLADTGNPEVFKIEFKRINEEDFDRLCELVRKVRNLLNDFHYSFGRVWVYTDSDKLVFKIKAHDAKFLYCFITIHL